MAPSVVAPPPLSPSPSGGLYPISEVHVNGLNGSNVLGLNGDTLINGNGTAAPVAPPLLFDTGQFRTYLATLLPPVIGASQEDLDRTLFEDEELDEKAAHFAEDTNLGAIYVVKKLEPTEDENAAPSYSYTLTHTLTYDPPPTATLALIKRVPTLDSTLPLSSQLHILNLYSPAEGGAPYESLHSLVHLGVAPWFDAYVSSRKGAQRGELSGGGQKGAMGKEEARTGIPMTKKKFAELELSLLHLQQNVEIPETHLSYHPVIMRAIEKAAAEGVRPSPDLLPQNLITDSTFLNKLQSDVNSWIKDIQGVTRLERDVANGTATQEINFWLGLEKEIESIEGQLRSEPILLAMEVLKNAKRFRATVSFMADTGLKDATEKVHKYNQLMKDFPLNELLSATDLDKVLDSLHQIFGHLNKKLRLSPYPIRRALPLVEAISRDFNDQLLRVLTSHRLMYVPYDTFDDIMITANEIFHTWDDQVKEFTNVAREVTRKRGEKFIPIKIVSAHAKLQERVVYLRQFRKQHEQLRVMTGPTKGLQGLAESVMDVDMEEEVRLAYDSVKNVDVLDVSTEGTEIWVTAETAYNERVARVENQIISRLRDRLGSARNANEMFRVFSKFNSLFVRPKIRGAIQEYQTQLIESVKDDITALHTKFKVHYRNTEAYHVAQMHDLPVIAGTILWARQIERQLQTYMKRVEDVLGKGWEHYAEGQKLQNESASFRKKLDARNLFDAWLLDINRRGMNVGGRLFEITKLRAQGNQYQLSVNFDAQILTISKEVRNLLWLNFQIPHSINTLAKDAKRVYPHAVSLMETVRTYEQTLNLINKSPSNAILLAEYRITCQGLISQGMDYKWEFYVNLYDAPAYGRQGGENRYIAWVRDFASAVSLLQDKTNSLIDSYKEITKEVEELAVCIYTRDAFSLHISKIQTIIDRLNLEGYSNLDSWVAALDGRIEGILVMRLTRIMQAWCAEFDRANDDGRAREMPVVRDIGGKRRLDKRKSESERHIEGGLQVKPIVHEIRIQNQVIFLDPPVEFARESWLKQLHDWLGVICGIRRVQSSRYEIGLQMPTAAETTYTSLLLQLNDKMLERPFALIESKVQQVKDYVAKWLQFQSLWDLEPEYVFNRLGDSLANWQQLLTEIKKTRSTFDNSDTERSFGVCVIDYEQVQARVNAKYDAWQKDILNRFGVKLGNAMKEMHASILKARHDLEHHSI